MSPGSNWPPANTITDSSNSVINDKPTRVARNRTTRPALPFGTGEAEGVTVIDIVISCRRSAGRSCVQRLLHSPPLRTPLLRSTLHAQHRAVEIELLECGEAHAVHTLAHRDQLIVEERNDHGRFVEQQRLDLSGDFLLRAQV